MDLHAYRLELEPAGEDPRRWRGQSRRFGASVALSPDGKPRSWARPPTTTASARRGSSRSRDRNGNSARSSRANRRTARPRTAPTIGARASRCPPAAKPRSCGGPPAGPFAQGGFWIYMRAGSTWSKQAEFDGEFYADSAALSADGNTALVGSIYSDSVHRRSAGLHAWARPGLSRAKNSAVNAADSARACPIGRRQRSAGWRSPGNRRHGLGVTRSKMGISRHGETLTGSKETGEGAFGASVALSENADTALIGGPGTTARSAPHGSSSAAPGRNGNSLGSEAEQRRLSATVDPDGENSAPATSNTARRSPTAKTRHARPAGLGDKPVAVSAFAVGLTSQTKRITSASRQPAPDGTSHGPIRRSRRSPPAKPVKPKKKQNRLKPKTACSRRSPAAAPAKSPSGRMDRTSAARRCRKALASTSTRTAPPVAGSRRSKSRIVNWAEGRDLVGQPEGHVGTDRRTACCLQRRLAGMHHGDAHRNDKTRVWRS